MREEPVETSTKYTASPRNVGDLSFLGVSNYEMPAILDLSLALELSKDFLSRG